MTVDEAIEQLTEFKRVYGGDYAMMISTSDDEDVVIVDFKRLGLSDGFCLKILTEKEVITKSCHLDEMDELRGDHREELDKFKKELKNAND